SIDRVDDPPIIGLLRAVAAELLTEHGPVPGLPFRQQRANPALGFRIELRHRRPIVFRLRQRTMRTEAGKNVIAGKSCRLDGGLRQLGKGRVPTGTHSRACMARGQSLTSAHRARVMAPGARSPMKFTHTAYAQLLRFGCGVVAETGSVVQSLRRSRVMLVTTEGRHS